MRSRRFLLGVGVFLLMGLLTAARGADAKPPTLENHRELARWLNVIKKAPQREYREQARKELQSLDVPMLSVVFALTLDHWLLASDDPVVRYRASAELARMKSPARIVAAGNLRNLIAAEENPYLKWQHAVALSSIHPDGGSAFELMNQIPDDEPHRRWLVSNRPLPSTIPRFDNENAIAELPLSNAEYQELTQMLRLEHFGIPGDVPWIINYASPVPIRIEDSPPPPPRKIPAHPLIAGRRFGEILRLMDQGSEEAWQLFHWYSEEFPPDEITKRYLPSALEMNWREREHAMRVLWSAGPDAEKAAALIYAVMHDLGIAHHVDMIERMKQPGHYSQEVLKHLRGHENPRVRAAVIAAMNRSPDMEPLLVETVRDSLQSDNRAMRRMAAKSLANLKIGKSAIQALLEENLLTAEDPELLALLVDLLKGRPATKEFQQKIFERIDAEQVAGKDLILIGYLMDQVADSEAGKPLQAQFQQVRRSLKDLRFGQRLEREIHAMIQEMEAIRQKTEQEAIEQLKKLLILTDD